MSKWQIFKKWLSRLDNIQWTNWNLIRLIAVIAAIYGAIQYFG